MRFRGLLLIAFWQCSNPKTDEVPPAPSGDPTTTADVRTFAINRLFLGDTYRTGELSGNAWQTFGYDLDGHITTVDSKDVCSSGGFRAGVDGLLGIDNAWGRSLLGVVSAGLDAERPSDDATQSIDAGEWTLLVQITGLDDDPKQTATGLAAQVFVGAKTAAPAFDTSVDWPVRPSSLNDSATIASGARTHFNRVYVTDGIIVATGADALTIPLSVMIYDAATKAPQRPAALTLRITHPLLTLSSNGQSGTIAGIISDADARGAATLLLRQLDSKTCVDGFVLIAGGEDIMADGANAPGIDCNAFSIGLGFEAKRVANPTTVGEEPARLVDPCAVADAGAD